VSHRQGWSSIPSYDAPSVILTLYHYFLYQHRQKSCRISHLQLPSVSQPVTQWVHVWTTYLGELGTGGKIISRIILEKYAAMVQCQTYEHSNEMQGDLQAEETTAQRILCNMQSSPSTCHTRN
jgi:hypothetical protein